MHDPKKDIYPKDMPGPLEKLDRIGPYVEILGLLLTLCIVIDSRIEHRIIYVYFATGAWAVIPPIWFFYEYIYLYRKYGNPDTFELFKHGQDLAKAVWAGVLAVLLAYAASDLYKLQVSCPSDEMQPTTQSANALQVDGRSKRQINSPNFVLVFEDRSQHRYALPYCVLVYYGYLSEVMGSIIIHSKVMDSND